MAHEKERELLEKFVAKYNNDIRDLLGLDNDDLFL